MSQHHFTFRSKSDRDRESNLVRNYREIGIAAIAAASQACRKDKAANDTRAKAPQYAAVSSGIARD